MLTRSLTRAGLGADAPGGTLVHGVTPSRVRPYDGAGDALPIGRLARVLVIKPFPDGRGRLNPEVG